MGLRRDLIKKSVENYLLKEINEKLVIKKLENQRKTELDQLEDTLIKELQNIFNKNWYSEYWDQFII